MRSGHRQLRRRSLAIVSLALASLATACGGGIKIVAPTTTTDTDASTATSTTPPTAPPTTQGRTTLPPATTTPASRLVGNWYGAQADDFAATCPGSTTYTFGANGQFSSATIYSPNAPSSCVNVSYTGTYTYVNGVLTVNARPNSPVGQAFTAVVDFAFINDNTFTIDGRMYHRG